MQDSKEYIESQKCIECGWPADYRCAGCQQFICADHAHYITRLTNNHVTQLCTDCIEKQQTQPKIY